MRLTWVFAFLLSLCVLTYLADATAATNRCMNPVTTRGPASDCKWESGDVKVHGKGIDWASAYEDAVTQCFEARRARYKAYRGVDSDQETAELYIETCANLTCN